jgi:hypothetical protein
LRGTRSSDSSADSISFDEFSANFDRCFGHLHRYVGRRARDRDELERVVGDVLEKNLALLVEPHERDKEVRQLEESADALLGRRSPS